MSSDDAPTSVDTSKWQYLLDGGVHIEERVEGEVGLLLGNNVAATMEPIEVIPGQDGGPFAVRTRYSWVLGGAERASAGRFKVHQIHATFNEDGYDNRAEYKVGPSAEDVRWCSIVESSCLSRDGQYEIALPFRHVEPDLPNNKAMAYKRLDQLKRKFQNQSAFASEYTRQMEELLERGCAEIVPENVGQKKGCIWYLPHHHGVENALKKIKFV